MKTIINVNNCHYWVSIRFALSRRNYYSTSCLSTSSTSANGNISLDNRRKTHGNFVDIKRIRIESGRGGDGFVHFAREPFKAVAPPDGGDGGRGSHIWFEIVESGRDLRHLKSRYTGFVGCKGGDMRKKGANGQDITISVPKGTIITEYLPQNPPKEWLLDSETGEQKENITKLPHRPLFIDTSHPFLPVGTRFMACIGAEGGKGNYHFQTSTNRSPEHFTEGKPGQLRYLIAEMKSIADIGLVGLPNAGKSSLVRSVSRCRTEIGSYAFTTLHPYLATVGFDAYRENQGTVITPFSMTIADIPGIIRGAASENRGLGHAFLRHIERTKLLAYIVDLSRPDVWKDLQLLISELECYKPGLALDKKGVVIANKADVEPYAQSNYEALQNYVESRAEELKGWSVVPISAKYGKNIGKALWKMREIVEKARRDEQKEYDEFVKGQMEEYGSVVDYPWMTGEYISGVAKVELPPVI